MQTSQSAIIILGASGDLAHRKLIPALARLFEQEKLDKTSIVVGSGRTELSDEQFRADFELPAAFADSMYYHQGLEGIKAFIDSKGSFRKVIVFMALPPRVYAHTAEELAREGFGAETTLIIEKPFGYDFDSAHRLNADLLHYFDEQQIYRIDHYLAKEAVQNILVFRFANSLFSPVWNSHYIDTIQINAFETIGVEDRGAYFDNAGIIRDMIQNHLTQLLALLTMEAPVSLNAEDIRTQKIDILKALDIRECCRYQYRGYHQEKGVAPDSTTETFAEMKLFINTFRWAGVPVYIRTGKALNRKGTEIGIRFKPLPRLLFNEQGEVESNKIIFKIQPAEGIVIDLSSKMPGGEARLLNSNLTFCYRDHVGSEIPEAYQRLLLDALRGDRTLFVSAEETELSWQKFQPFLDNGPVHSYERGTVPAPCLTHSWIDFDRYVSACAP
jgi:glucose-6-phosphate 1-dehydrogenase